MVYGLLLQGPPLWYRHKEHSDIASDQRDIENRGFSSNLDTTHTENMLNIILRKRYLYLKRENMSYVCLILRIIIQRSDLETR